jgi:hypothetical protein
MSSAYVQWIHCPRVCLFPFSSASQEASCHAHLPEVRQASTKPGHFLQLIHQDDLPSAIFIEHSYGLTRSLLILTVGWSHEGLHRIHQILNLCEGFSQALDGLLSLGRLPLKVFPQLFTLGITKGHLLFMLS